VLAKQKDLKKNLSAVKQFASGLDSMFDIVVPSVAEG
jgi:RNAse (barnase) inhibitor barstar